MLTLNLNLLWTVVNVLVLFLLLRKFLYRPVMNIIAERQKQVDDALAAAETSKSEAAAALNAAQDKLRNVDDEAAARRKAYEQQAEKEKQQLMAEAKSIYQAGLEYFRNNELEKAIQEWEKIQFVDPSNTFVLDEIRQAKLKIKQKEIEEYQTVFLV